MCWVTELWPKSMPRCYKGLVNNQRLQIFSKDPSPQIIRIWLCVCKSVSWWTLWRAERDLGREPSCVCLKLKKFSIDSTVRNQPPVKIGSIRRPVRHLPLTDSFLIASCHSVQWVTTQAREGVKICLFCPPSSHTGYSTRISNINCPIQRGVGIAFRQGICRLIIDWQLKVALSARRCRVQWQWQWHVVWMKKMYNGVVDLSVFSL